MNIISIAKQDNMSLKITLKMHITRTDGNEYCNKDCKTSGWDIPYC